ncbi:MAG TPA: EI24 domain-containing protein [Acetobacteraceae bacterium]|nr:EI24 domain-containing protein [Acetobacteraceae bacterium]
MSPLLSPLLRALDQLGDRVFLGVLLRSAAWSALCFVLLYGATFWGVRHMLHLHGMLAWAAGLLGAVGATLLALWLFLPVAAVIATLYIERIARAVERRYYPWLPPPRGAPIGEQIADGLGLGVRILLLNVIALVLVVLLPGIGLVLGWAIAAFGIGRGLFVAVAMRRMPRPAAMALYHRFRSAVLVQGGLMALAAYVPVLNLLIPVLGTAAMVHVLDHALTGSGEA